MKYFVLLRNLDHLLKKKVTIIQRKQDPIEETNSHKKYFKNIVKIIGFVDFNISILFITKWYSWKKKKSNSWHDMKYVETINFVIYLSNYSPNQSIWNKTS